MRAYYDVMYYVCEMLCSRIEKMMSHKMYCIDVCMRHIMYIVIPHYWTIIMYYVGHVIYVWVSCCICVMSAWCQSGFIIVPHEES